MNETAKKLALIASNSYACSGGFRIFGEEVRMSTTSYEVTGVETSEMVLEREGTEVTIRIGHRTLMWSDVHDSEEQLGRIVAAAVSGVASPRILIGGLGLGFTLRAALSSARQIIRANAQQHDRLTRGRHRMGSDRT